MSTMHPNRRGFLATMAAGAALGAPIGVGAAGPSRLRAVLDTEVSILDPHLTTTFATRTFGYHVFDTLFATDDRGEIHPQMVDRHSVSQDRLNWTFVLRDGLEWHDDQPVTAADCVASIQRWAPGDGVGRLLLEAASKFSALDAKTFTIELRKPFELMLFALGKPNAPVPFMMPARILPPAGRRITSIIGSGPYRHIAEEMVPGDRMTLRRFAKYRPRSEEARFLSGRKVPLIDEIQLRVMPDAATAVRALQAGELDYVQFVPFDLLASIANFRDVRLQTLSGGDMFQGHFRLNHASGPFGDPAVRKVLLKLVDQGEIITALGVPKTMTVPCDSIWTCGTPFESAEGSRDTAFDLAEARRRLAATSYKGEPVMMLAPAESINQIALAVLAEHMRKVGFKVDEQVMDWGTVLARSARRTGWSMFSVYNSGIDSSSPVTHRSVINNCGDFPGWNCDPAITDLMQAFIASDSEDGRRAIAGRIQSELYRSVPFVNWGQFARPAAYRSTLSGLAQSSFPLFFNARMS